MKIQISEIDGSRKEIRVEMDFQELEPFVSTATSAIKENFSAPGFRKGKAPSKILLESKKEDILLGAAKDAVEKKYLQIIKENKIEVIGKPQIDILKLAWNNPLEFKINVWVMPQINLPDYKKIIGAVKKKEILVEEKEIEEAIKWLQKTRAKKILKNGSCQKGDFVEIKYQSSLVKNNQEIKEGFIVGQSHFLLQFEENIIGLKAGDKKEFTIDLKASREDSAPREERFVVQIDAVYTLELQELTDEWAKSLGAFNSLLQLKDSIKDGIKKEKEEIEKQRIQAEILQKIRKELGCPIPQILIDIETEQIVRDFKKKIPQTLQITFEEYLKRVNLDEKGFRKSLLGEVESKIKNFFILKEIKEKEGIVAKAEEIKEEVNSVLERFGAQKEAHQAFDPKDLYDYTKERIENRKTLERLEDFIKDKK